MKEFVDLEQGTLHDDRAGGLGGDITVLAERDSDRGGGQRRGVVDAVTEEDGLRLASGAANELDLLLRGLSEVDFADPDPGRHVTHLRLAVPRDEHDPVEPMPW